MIVHKTVGVFEPRAEALAPLRPPFAREDQSAVNNMYIATIGDESSSVKLAFSKPLCGHLPGIPG